MEAMIITVKGAVRPEELGFCQPHEHLFVAEGPSTRVYPALLIDDVKKSTADAVSFALAGGSAVTDAQPVFTGRDARALKEISEASGVNIIASTGFHKLVYYREGCPVPEMEEEELAELFTGEIKEGMYAGPYYSDAPERTAIRAGQIKAALEPEFNITHKKLFKAAARASAATGAPIMVHVDEGADPLALLGFLAGLGVPAEKQIYCHLDRAESDVSVHKAIAGAGAFLEYDTVMRPKYRSEDAEMGLVLHMAEEGYAGRMLMSLDTTRERLKGYGGAPGLDYIITRFIPGLKGRGMDDGAVKTIFLDNPAAVYACGGQD